MYVWRFPVISFAWLVVTFGLTATLLGLLEGRRRVRSPAFRGLLLAGGIAAGILSPFVVQTLTEEEVVFLAKHGMYHHYAPWAFILPLVSAVLLVAADHFLFRENATKWRAYFLFTTFGLAFLNLVNWCSPGWCARFGFPFPYSWWSDSIMVINGVTFGAGTSRTAAVADLGVLVAVTILLVRSARRSQLREPDPSGSGAGQQRVRVGVRNLRVAKGEHDARRGSVLDL